LAKKKLNKTNVNDTEGGNHAMLDDASTPDGNDENLNSGKNRFLMPFVRNWNSNLNHWADYLRCHFFDTENTWYDRRSFSHCRRPTDIIQ
jgi:hypothetical protein